MTTEQFINKYKGQTFKAVLFDMDGVLYDSMPLHSRAWMAMCRRYNLKAQPEEFFSMEGRTGASTIDILMERQYGRKATPEEIKEMYALKSRIFAAFGVHPMMPGALEAVETVISHRLPAVLVTGSGQTSLLEKLNKDYRGAFPASRRVTAHDVAHGKPHPEPYEKGATLAGAAPAQCIAIDNAPLGVESAHAAGCITIGVRTGPIPQGALLASGADVEINSMAQCTNLLCSLL